jgi:hypothetical protein
VQDLDRQVLAGGPEHLHLLLADHLAGAMVGVYDMVA